MRLNTKNIYKLSPDELASMSLLGLLVLLIVAVIALQSDLVLVTHNLVKYVTTGQADPQSMWAETGANLLLGLFLVKVSLSLVLGVLTRALLGKDKSDSDAYLDHLLSMLSNGPAVTFAALAKEEVIFRLLPALAGHILFGMTGQWVFLMIANISFALVHLNNYDDSKDRQYLRVLPQFIGGLFYAYIITAYGFWIAVIMHIAYDVFLFSLIKSQPVKRGFFKGLLVDALVLACCLIFLHSDLTWVHLLVFSRENLPPNDLIKWSVVLIAIGKVFEILARVLLLDKIRSDSAKDSLLSEIWMSTSTVLAIAFLSWLSGVFTADPVTRAAVVTTFVLVQLNAVTGSALVRLLLIYWPMFFLVALIVNTYGWMFAIGVCVVIEISSVIEYFFHSEESE